MSHHHTSVADFLTGKTDLAKTLFHHFEEEYRKIGPITMYPAKTMIGIDNGTKRIAWVTQLGKNFIHVVFPFTQSYPDNFCFHKIAVVPGNIKQHNHHFRMCATDDINDEVKHYMKMAYHLEK